MFLNINRTQAAQSGLKCRFCHGDLDLWPWLAIDQTRRPCEFGANLLSDFWDISYTNKKKPQTDVTKHRTFRNSLRAVINTTHEHWCQLSGDKSQKSHKNKTYTDTAVITYFQKYKHTTPLCYKNSSRDEIANVTFLRRHRTCTGQRLRPLNRLPNFYYKYLCYA